MDCATSGWHQCLAFPGDGPSHHHTCGGVFAGSILWRASSQSIWFSDWWGTSFLGPGHCGQTDVPIWPAASWSDLDPPWVTPRPWRYNSSRIQPFWGHGWTLLRFPLGGPPVAPGWLEGPYLQLLWQGLQWGRCSGSSDWHPGGA